MNKKLKVLVFPCGSENGAEIHQALRYSIHVDLVGASSVEDFGRFRFERYVGGLPNIRDERFDVAFAGLISKLAIDVVFATHDSVLEYLSRKAAAMDFFLVNGDPEATALVRRKSATYRLFADYDWTPKSFGSLDEIPTWPVVVKPDMGQGGQGVMLVHARDEAAAAARRVEDPIFVEYLPGSELTVDCFSDRKGQLIWVGPRTRERVRAGITMRSRAAQLTSEINAIASQINERLRLRGPWFFQLKEDGRRKWKLLEVACRVAGAMVAQRARGVNLPLMAIHDYLGRDLTVFPLPQIQQIERNIATRAALTYEYKSVFVDLDHTLIIDDYANPIVLAFLYQCVRDGKRIILLTRHTQDVGKTLVSVRIALNLFDKILQLPDHVSKADYITHDSIFIDNHFPERLEVFRKCAIPVFDIDALEFLVR